MITKCTDKDHSGRAKKLVNSKLSYNINEKDNHCFEMLMNEYNVRNNESIFHSQRYHKQLKYIQIYVVIAVSLFSLLIVNPRFSFHTDSNIILFFNDTIIYSLFALTSILAFFIISNFMDSLYMIFSNNARIASIERQLNKIVDQDIMVWESHTTNFILSTNPFMKFPWIRPYYLVGLWSIVLFTGIQFMLIYLSFIIVNGIFCWIYLIVSFILSIYHINIWVYTSCKWKKVMDSIILN